MLNLPSMIITLFHWTLDLGPSSKVTLNLLFMSNMVEFEFVPRKVCGDWNIASVSKLGSLGIGVYVWVGCVVRISRVEDVHGVNRLMSNGEYFLNIEWISNPQSPHRIFHFVYMFSIRKFEFWFLQCDVWYWICALSHLEFGLWKTVLIIPKCGHYFPSFFN